MKARRVATALLLIVVLVAACNYPPRQITPDANLVATQVNQLLTSSPNASTPQVTLAIPSLSPVPTITPTLTELPTEKPTNTTVPSETPMVTPTTEATSQSAETTTPVVEDPRDTLGTPTGQDTFSSTQNWGIFSDEHIVVEPGIDSLLMTAIKPDGWHGWTMSNIKLTNFYVEATIQPGKCDGKDSYGVMVRAPEFDHGYFYGLSCDGRYVFQKWDGSQFSTLVNWTGNSAIHSGMQSNRLGIMAKGSDFTFYANGIKLGSAKDSSYDQGSIGLWVASYTTPDFKIQVSEVDYWDLGS